VVWQGSGQGKSPWPAPMPINPEFSVGSRDSTQNPGLFTSQKSLNVVPATPKLFCFVKNPAFPSRSSRPTESFRLTFAERPFLSINPKNSVDPSLSPTRAGKFCSAPCRREPCANRGIPVNAEIICSLGSTSAGGYRFADSLTLTLMGHGHGPEPEGEGMGLVAAGSIDGVRKRGLAGDEGDWEQADLEPAREVLAS
jgi:hypothetical protein